MNLVFEITIGKKYTIYLPRLVVKALKIREGDKALLRVSGRSIIIEPLADPIELAISGSKFAEVKPEDVEAISVEEQRKYLKGTT